MAGPSISYDIGYSGVVKLGDSQVLATGGNVSIQHTPLYTSGVWGAGWYNATEKISFAPNYVTLTSSVNYQLTQGITTTLEDWAFKKRNVPKKVTIYPNGIAGYSGSAYCTGCSFSCSQDAIVSGDISLKSGEVKSTIKSNGSNGSSNTMTSNDSIGSGSLSAVSKDYMCVYPFWATAVYFSTATNNTERTPPSNAENLGTLQADTLDWSASYTSDLVFVMTCCGTSDSGGSSGGVIEAKYCCLGTMQASGSITLFKINQHLVAQNIRNCRNIRIKMNKADGKSACQIVFGKVLLQSGSTDLQTGTSLIQSSFNFTALGNGSQPPMGFDALNP